MSLWLWALAVLTGAGLVAALAGVGVAVTGIVRLQRRLAALRESSFVTKLESLQIQTARLTRVSADAEELRRRAQAALDSLRKTPEVAGAAELRTAWRQCAAQIRTIVQELS
jgi:hypothetical protein